MLCVFDVCRCPFSFRSYVAIIAGKKEIVTFTVKKNDDDDDDDDNDNDNDNDDDDDDDSEKMMMRLPHYAWIRLSLRDIGLFA